jgi:hypothetical protein
MEAVEQIRSKLLDKYKQPAQIELVATSILYVQKKIAEVKKDKDTQKWVKSYTLAPDFLLQSIAECIDNGFALDGVNYVISGNRMYMPTYKAFKNKIYMVYPESEVDVQVVRKGDTYHFAKESGSAIYSHDLADPFEHDDLPVIGAYCVIKNKRGEFLETLNKRDYEAMRNASKSPKTWDSWPSEFWRKSVIKRACKTHFNDITSAIEEQDNNAVGLAEVVKASPDKKAAIIAAAKSDHDDQQS